MTPSALASEYQKDNRLAREFWDNIDGAQRRKKSRVLGVLGCISPARRSRYLVELKECLAYCLDNEVTRPLRIFCRRWINAGAPVDPKVLYVPRTSLQIILRQVVTALPDMSRHHADARLWLQSHMFRPSGVSITGERIYPGLTRSIGGRSGIQYEKPYEEVFIPFNLLLYAPKDSPYERFNKIGFTLEVEDDE